MFKSDICLFLVLFTQMNIVKTVDSDIFICKNVGFGEYQTGCSYWKLSKANSSRTETGHIWPYVGKVKMRVRGDS